MKKRLDKQEKNDPMDCDHADKGDKEYEEDKDKDNGGGDQDYKDYGGQQGWWGGDVDWVNQKGWGTLGKRKRNVT